MMKRVLSFVMGLVAFAGLALSAQPTEAREALVAELSSHEVSITTGFVGTDLLLFGATEGRGDVILEIRGPAREQTVMRKDRIMGLWVNADGVTFKNVPAFYIVASSRPLAEIINHTEAEKYQIGFDHLRLPVVEEGLAADQVQPFRAGLIRLKQDKGLYREQPDVRFQGPYLFRADLHFPAELPVGEYQATVYLVDDMKVVSQKDLALKVQKVGIGAEIYRFAYDHAALYGIIAIIVAVVAGWLASVIFRKA